MDVKKEDTKRRIDKVDSEADLKIVLEYEKRVRNKKIEFFSMEAVKKCLEKNGGIV